MNAAESPFKLDARLESDCHLLGRFPLSLLLLMDDATYPWCILVPERVGISEIYQLNETDRAQLAVESAHLSERLAIEFAADKMNVAALGNVVPQLHVHHIVRYRTDPAWPGPVWGNAAPSPYTKEVLAETKGRVVSGLGEGFRAG